MNIIKNHIEDIKNWTEVARGYYRYAVSSTESYEILALQKGAETGPDYYSLYRTSEEKDQTNTPYFRRECLKHYESLTTCLSIVVANFQCHLRDKEYDPVASKEDIENLERYLNRCDSTPTMEPNEAKSLVRVILDIYKTVKDNEE